MRKGEVMRPFRAPRQLQGRHTQTKAVDVQSDSEEATALGLVMKPWIIKETEDQFIPRAQDKSESLRSNTNVPDLHGTPSGNASPNVLEFETYLDTLESRGVSTMASSPGKTDSTPLVLSLIHISEPTRPY